MGLMRTTRPKEKNEATEETKKKREKRKKKKNEKAKHGLFVPLLLLLCFVCGFALGVYFIASRQSFLSLSLSLSLNGVKFFVIFPSLDGVVVLSVAFLCLTRGV